MGQIQAEVAGLRDQQRSLSQVGRVEESQSRAVDDSTTLQRTEVTQLNRESRQLRDASEKQDQDRAQWRIEKKRLRGEIDKLRTWAQTMIPSGDWLSRDLFVDACHEAGWDAVVLTNVIVDPGAGMDAEWGYRNQVEHVVVTNAGVVVENKYWSGLITTPRRVRDAKVPVAEFFADTIVDEDLDKIIQIRHVEAGDGHKAQQVSCRVGDPVNQVVRHSIAVKKACAHAGCDAGYVGALVLFSHKKARVDLGQCPSDHCRYAVGGGELKESLEQTMSTSGDGVDVRAVVTSLAQHRPNVVGTGCYADVTAQDEPVPEISWKP